MPSVSTYELWLPAGRRQMDFRTPMLELWAYQKGGNDMNKKQENDPKKEMIMDIFDDQTGEKLKRYKYLNQFIVQGQILFVGSSLMEQFPINELQQTLDKKFIIYNRGVSGFVTEELLRSEERRVGKEWRAQGRPTD